MPVAAPRVFFAAHHRGCAPLRHGQELHDTLLIPWLACHDLVIHVSGANYAVPVTDRIGGAATEQVARPEIADARVVEQPAQRTLAEVGNVAAVRGAAHVDERRDAVLA